MITGASSGIGKGIALEIAARGAHLGLLARREDLLNEINTQLSAMKQDGTYDKLVQKWFGS